MVKGIGRLKDERNIKSWVVTITKNEVYNFINKRNRELNRRVIFDDVITSGFMDKLLTDGLFIDNSRLDNLVV